MSELTFQYWILRTSRIGSIVDNSLAGKKPKDIEKSANNFLDALNKTEKVSTSSKLERVILMKQQ